MPEVDVAVIGDLHGRADLLEQMLTMLAKEASEAQVLCVGDYVDRGPDSKAVLQRLRSHSGNMICLLGNHEVMMLDFLEDPVEHGGRWLRNGGVTTLASFGINLDEGLGRAELLKARDALQAELGDGTRDWLDGLPIYWQSGNLLVTHAGPDPKLPIDRQDEASFLWGHNRFLRDARNDDLWVAHGHWIKDRGTCASARIAVDTGAWTTGKLTAAFIQKDGSVRFIST